jgi:hypothetical protein
MTARRSGLLLILALLVLAGGLRFFRLGAWPFGGDELSTFVETTSLFDPDDDESTVQLARLPRVIPVGYLVHSVGYHWFGTDEFGSRALLALLGTLQVVLVFVGLARPLGRPAALTTAVLLAVWPEHIYFCQYNRFYLPAGFLTSLCLIAGARAVAGHSTPWAAAAALLGAAAVLTHTLTVVLLPGLCVALLLPALASRRPLPWRHAGAVVLVGLALAAVGLVLLAPKLRGWNGSAGWGTGPAHSFLAWLSQVGWPVVCLAGLALAFLRRSADAEQVWYWLTFAGVAAAAAFVFPIVLVYHSAYLFALTLPVFVLAGLAVGKVYEQLPQRSPWLAAAGLAALAALSLPGLASHYSDGSRNDYRAVARYLEKHRREGDAVGAVGPSCLRHYLPGDVDVQGLDESAPLKDLRKLAPGCRRMWIAIPSGRRGKPEELQRWLNEHCKQELVVRRPRVDYRDYVVEVYLYTAPEPARPAGPVLAGELE